MGASALVLVLGAAVAHAGWNLAAKRAGTGGAALVWLVATGSTAAYAPVALVTLLVTDARLDHTLLLGVLVSGVLHLGYFLALQRGYAVGDLSLVYPVARGTGPLLAVAVAVVVLGERPGWLGLAGAALVVVGVLIVGGGLRRPSRPHRPVPGSRPPAFVARLSSGAGYGLLTGSLIAAYTVWDAHAVAVLAVAPVLFDWGNNLVRAVLLTPYAWRRFDRVRTVWTEHRPEVLVIVVLGPLAYILVLFAFTQAPVSLVAPARGLSDFRCN